MLRRRPARSPASGSGTARCAAAERGIGSIPAIPGEAVRIQSVRPALQLAPSLSLFKQYLTCWWFGFFIIIVIIILSVIFVVVVAAAAPVNLSHSHSLSPRVFLIFRSPCAGLNVVFCFVF